MKKTVLFFATLALAATPIAASAATNASKDVKTIAIIDPAPTGFSLNFDSLDFRGQIGGDAPGNASSTDVGGVPTPGYTVSSLQNYSVMVSSSGMQTDMSQATTYMIAPGRMSMTLTNDENPYGQFYALTPDPVQIESGTMTENKQSHLFFNLDLRPNPAYADNLIDIPEQKTFTGTVTFSFTGL